MWPVVRSERTCAPVLAAGILLSLPTTALANVISVFEQNSIMHLAVGNAVIGVIEGALIAMFFRARAGRTILLMIVAN